MQTQVGGRKLLSAPEISYCKLKLEGGSCCQRQRSVIANSSWREEAAVSARDQLLQTQVGGRKLLSAPEISYCKLKLEGGSCCQRQRPVIANSSWREEAAVSARDQLLQTQVGGRKLLSAPEISYCKLKLEGGSCCQRQRSVIANSSWREEAAVSARDQLLQTQVGGRKLLSAPEISYCKLKLEGGSCCQRQRSVIANSSWREEAAVSARDQLLQTQVGGRKLLSAPEISYCKLKLEGGSCCQRQRSVIANSSWREEAAVSARDQLLQTQVGGMKPLSAPEISYC